MGIVLVGGTPFAPKRIFWNVYFLRCGDKIKIGKTRGSVENRVKQLQTGSASVITILRVITGADGNLEADLHRRFAHARIRGEWFKPSRELLRFIQGSKK